MKEDGALEGFGDRSAALGREEIGLSSVPPTRPVCRQHLLCAIDAHVGLLVGFRAGQKNNAPPDGGGGGDGMKRREPDELAVGSELVVAGDVEGG